MPKDNQLMAKFSSWSYLQSLEKKEIVLPRDLDWLSRGVRPSEEVRKLANAFLTCLSLEVTLDLEVVAEAYFSNDDPLIPPMVSFMSYFNNLEQRKVNKKAMDPQERKDHAATQRVITELTRIAETLAHDQCDFSNAKIVIKGLAILWEGILQKHCKVTEQLSSASNKAQRLEG